MFFSKDVHHLQYFDRFKSTKMFVIFLKCFSAGLFVLNLFGQISVSVFNFITHFEDCSDEKYLRLTFFFVFFISASNNQRFDAGYMESTSSFASFLKKVIHHALMFLNLNQRKPKNNIRFLQMFLHRIVCNLFGHFYFNLFSLLPKIEDCFDEIYLRPTTLGFLFQRVITNSSRLETLIQPLFLEVSLKSYSSCAHVSNFIQIKSKNSIRFLQMFLSMVVCNLFRHISVSVFSLLQSFEVYSSEMWMRVNVFFFFFNW